MRLPTWARVTRTQRTAPNAVTVTIAADFTSLTAALARMTPVSFAPFVKAAAEMKAVMDQVAADFHNAGDALEAVRRRMENQQVARKAGLEARFYVRGAMGPTYADPAARDAYVRHLLRESPALGAYLAASFLTGWVEHHPDPLTPAP